MKKALRQELVSLAHKILQLKDDKPYEQLAQTAQELYEKLAILAYAEKLETGTQPTFTVAKLEEKLETILSQNEEGSLVFEAPADSQAKKEDHHRPDGTSYNKDEPLHEPVIEKIKNMVAQMPAETDPIDERIGAMEPASGYVKNDMLEIGGEFAQIPIFDPVEAAKPKNLNDKLKDGFKIGLNDKLAFVKHLFDGSEVDYNRVLSQLTSFDSVQESKNFVHSMVKPDYNNWEGKEALEERFLLLIENRFE